LNISKEYIYTYLDSLERAKLLSDILPAKTGYRLVRKPSKTYMENTNLMKAVTGELDEKDKTGAVRETFFAHQVKSSGMNIRIPGRADFLVENTCLFEIGGKNKSKSQVKGAEEAFVVRDDIEVGYGDILPLWLFGFLY